MANKERWGTRDLSYSGWHRTLGSELTYTDIDACEYCYKCEAPLVLIETAMDVGQSGKYTVPIYKLAKAAGIPFYLVFYKPVNDSMMLRVKKIGTSEIIPMDESEYIRFLTSFRLGHKCLIPDPLSD